MRMPGKSGLGGWGWRVVVATAFLILGGPRSIEAQDLRMNFFLSVDGPGGTNFGAVIVSDGHCHDQGYAAGFGDLTWKAYLTGTAADGEAGEVARQRIGTGPWYNFAGVLIAENLDQLHSDAGNLIRATALTVQGGVAPAEVAIPSGSQLDGSSFTRNGPLLCFGVP
jgi:hypothetical protein